MVLDVHGAPRHSVRGIIVHRDHLYVADEAGDRVKIFEVASGRLVAQAQIVTSSGFREWQRSQIQGQGASGSAPLAPAELEARIDRRQDEALTQIFAAMEVVGGPEAVAYCLAFAEYEAAPLALRRAALGVLVRHVDRNDPAAVKRSAALWERLKAAPAAP